jgi:hypothetical protein
LGATRGKYKLSAFYWTLANLPPDLKSSVDNIQLASLCKFSEANRVGVVKVLQKIFEDAAVLETEGTFVGSLLAHIRGSITVVAADDLAAHMLFGMVQSFEPAVSRFRRFAPQQMSKL